MIVWDETSPRWLRELARFVHIKSLLFVYGNVHDLISFPIRPEGSDEVRWTESDLPVFFRRFLADLEYEVVRWVDPVEDLSFATPEMADRFEQVETGREIPSQPPCVRNDRAPAMIPRPSPLSSAPREPEPVNWDLTLPRITCGLENTQIPCAFVIDLASRLVSSPDRLTRDERTLFTKILKASLAGREVVREEGEAATRCPNLNCPARKLSLLTHWAGRQAMDIDGLGPAVAEQLLERGLVQDPVDLYHLTVEQVAELDRMAEKSARNLIDAIAASRDRGLERLIFALGILHVGRTAAARLAERYQSLEEIARAAQEELEEIPDVGPKIAESLRRYFDQPQHHDLIERLKDAGIVISRTAEPVSEAGLAGLSFVFTGALERMTRDEAEELVRRLGGRAASSVSRNTDYVVAGPGAAPSATRR